MEVRPPRMEDMPAPLRQGSMVRKQGTVYSLLSLFPPFLPLPPPHTLLPQPPSMGVAQYIFYIYIIVKKLIYVRIMTPTYFLF